MTDSAAWLPAGRVGRPHGLDGSFYVIDPVATLLHEGTSVRIDGTQRTITRRAGLDARPIIAVDGCGDRSAADALRGRELLVARERAPELEDEEWWAADLEGCAVRDGATEVGVVARLLALPSCEVLEVRRAAGAGELLVPLVADAVRSVDIERKLIEIDLRFLGEDAP